MKSAIHLGRIGQEISKAILGRKNDGISDRVSEDGRLVARARRAPEGIVRRIEIVEDELGLIS